LEDKMADQSNEQDRQPGQDQTSGQQNQQSEFAQQGQQSQGHREDAGQSPLASPGGSGDGTTGGSSIGSGQPLGGNESATGSGTTLSQGFESSSTVSLNHASESQNELSQNAGGPSGFSETDRQGSGFIAAQGTGSDDYLQANNPELSREDSLDQQSDDGMGLAGSQE
jgi:hypothetical protein